MMISYLQLNIPVDLPAVVIEGDQLEPVKKFVRVSLTLALMFLTALTWEC